jgi:hypothetical protein
MNLYFGGESIPDPRADYYFPFQISPHCSLRKETAVTPSSKFNASTREK